MYQLHPPAPDLAPFVEHYWLVTPNDGPVDLRVDVFVDGRPDLVFNFGVGYRRGTIGGAVVEQQASTLDAQRTVPIRIEQRGLVRVTGVRFRLGGLGPFARGRLGAFTDRTPPPAEVLGDEVLALESALSRADGPEEAAGHLDAFLRARLTVDDGRATFERALSTLVESEGRSTVRAVASRAGVSTRHLDRLFDRHLGLPPKTVGRILRFQGALRALMRDPDGSLAEVAASAGYYDQAHFVRDFKRMTGGVPRGYRGYYPPDAPSDFAPNVVLFVQDPGAADGPR